MDVEGWQRCCFLYIARFSLNLQIRKRTLDVANVIGDKKGMDYVFYILYAAKCGELFSISVKYFIIYVQNTFHIIKDSHQKFQKSRSQSLNLNFIFLLFVQSGRLYQFGFAYAYAI